MEYLDSILSIHPGYPQLGNNFGLNAKIMKYLDSIPSIHPGLALGLIHYKVQTTLSWGACPQGFEPRFLYTVFQLTSIPHPDGWLGLDVTI